jgi:hypothetical protein
MSFVTGITFFSWEVKLMRRIDNLDIEQLTIDWRMTEMQIEHWCSSLTEESMVGR